MIIMSNYFEKADFGLQLSVQASRTNPGYTHFAQKQGMKRTKAIRTLLRSA